MKALSIGDFSMEKKNKQRKTPEYVTQATVLSWQDKDCFADLRHIFKHWLPWLHIQFVYYKLQVKIHKRNPVTQTFGVRTELYP